ncbi:flagellar hook-length control protein FliK [Massilia sp. TSP1-1-2]|uniref:flagellar hook-length control protein FliK n=1 Tax=Massilia sp. TSP1-1-2 TaxID=2804649 RepID=UPI003CF9B643
MQLRTDLTPAGTVGKVDRAGRADGVADPRQEAFQRTMSGMVGKSMLSQVLSRLVDGNYIVRVAGDPVRMQLPPGTRIGSEVPLTLLSADPRPTFQITNGNGQALPGTLYTPPSPASQAAQLLADTANALPAKGAAATAGAGGTGGAAPLQAAVPAKDGAAAALLAGAPPAPVLSDAGRVISSVIVAAQNAPGAALALAGHQPLMANHAPDPAQLAARLQDAIGQSGLFYESHLAEWAEGTRPLSELMREPQTGRLPSPVTDPTTAQFINLQLTSQEQARVAWQGQLLPGQHMAWDIRKDATDGHGGRGAGGEEAPTWRSGMTFRLPLLGEIAATVVMAGDTFQIEIQTGSSAVGSLLRSHAAELTGAMEAAGTPLSSLSIGHKREDGDG